MNNKSAEPMIRCMDLVKIYKTGDVEVLALQGLDFTVERGELMAVVGNSGSGKSTLLNMLGGLDTPSAGRLLVNGKSPADMSARAMNHYKNKTVGFLWQNNARNFMPYLSILDNILLPMRLGGKPDREYALRLLNLTGLSDKAHAKPSQLSGGEQQRAAMAVALANKPALLLADEPTGALDTKTTAQILTMLREINRELGTTMIIVTHDRQVAEFVDRVVTIRDGRTSSELRRDGDEAVHHEYAILDKYGRLQLPAACIESLQLDSIPRLDVSYDSYGIYLTVPGRESQPEMHFKERTIQHEKDQTTAQPIDVTPSLDGLHPLQLREQSDESRRLHGGRELGVLVLGSDNRLYLERRPHASNDPSTDRHNSTSN